jgi:methylase of polypeptide subunit release factors
MASDIAEGRDFLKTEEVFNCDAIVTNPPYVLAREFIEHALRIMRPVQGIVAMLLRTDFDHAATRQHLFSGCEAFAKKVVLTKRIVWFDGPNAAPSFNHAWYIWNWRHVGPPTLAYAVLPASMREPGGK